MSIKYGTLFSALLFMFFSCSHKEQFPEKVFERLNDDKVVLNHSFFSNDQVFHSDSIQKKDFGNELNSLMLQIDYYNTRNLNFNLDELENLWIVLEKQSGNFNLKSTIQWIEISGFLLELSGDAIYAGELEKTVMNSPSLFSKSECKEIENQVVPWIFTKNVDHIHVNLIANATVKYEHTLKGAVEITQESNFPKTGEIQIKFKMGEKRYIEFFVRIPDWANGATVTEKGVKYVATPGSYCQIVRKWSDGNFVEVNLPIEQMP